jgi:hypothetical protein
MAKQLELFTNHFKLTEIGLEISGNPDIEDIMDYAQTLKVLDGTSRQFAIGDLIASNWGRHEQGKRKLIAQIWPEQAIATLDQWARISRKVEFCTRVQNLSFTHHREVADLKPQEQSDWLQWAIDNKSSVHKLRLEIAESKKNDPWDKSERERRATLDTGHSVLANQKTDNYLIPWAKTEGLYVDIGRGSIWGNPFEVDKDGTREEVIEKYKVFLDLKTSLHDKLESLNGKVLGCWCYPEPCHGHVLIGEDE